MSSPSGRVSNSTTTTNGVADGMAPLDWLDWLDWVDNLEKSALARMQYGQ